MGARRRLDYSYDAVGNNLDVANALYDNGTATSLDTLGDVPENNVPGPAQQSYTYDGHYRMTGAVGHYTDRQEDRDFSYQSDHAPNGNLLSKSQVTTTTSTTGGGDPKKRARSATKSGGTGGGGGKRGHGSGVPPDGSSATEDSCDWNSTSPSPSAPPPPCDPALETCTCDPSEQACATDDPTGCDDGLGTTYDPGTQTCQPTPDLTIHFLHSDLHGSLRVATDERGGVSGWVFWAPDGQRRAAKCRSRAPPRWA